MMQEMKKSREIVLKEIMMKVVSGKIPVNEGLKQIRMFDEEAKTAFETVMNYEQLCYQFVGKDLTIS